MHIGEIGVAVDRIKQNVVFCKNETDKRRKLEELISATAPPVIVFVNQKSTCESIMKFLTQAGVRYFEPLIRSTNSSQL